MTQFKQAKTFFQTGREYDPRLDIPVDAVVVHPHNTLPHEPLKMQDSWADKGIPVGRMFFADSDDLNEYGVRDPDGTCRSPDVELKKDGSPMLCSGIRPYMVPTDEWITYLRERKLQPSLDNRIDAILPEEPLGHTHTGYEEAMKNLYKEEYGSEWSDPAESAEVHYRIARLKALLYHKLESELCAVAKKHAKQAGTSVDFVVPIHSLFGNKANRLTAPLGLSLKNREFDGYIGQVWTGPVQWCMESYSSSEVSFFTTAFTLYDYFVQLVAGTGRKLWLLVDPVEDNPHHGWADFRSWYQQCTVAMLLMREVNSYEVMPWPERVFLPISFTPGIDDPADNPTPPDYFTLVLSITQALQEMPAGGEWLDGAQDAGLGIAVADSAMWKPNDGHALQGLFGLRIPLLERGIIARNFVMERAGDLAYGDQFKVIVLSYEDWDPYDESMNEQLERWVRRGGTLVVLGKGGDAQTALLDRLDGPKGIFDWCCGAGRVLYHEASPKSFADASAFEAVYKPLLEKSGINTTCRNGFAMQRGDYVMAHALNENFSMDGSFVDVFSPGLEVVKDAALSTGTCGLFKLFDPTAAPSVVHSTCGLMEQCFEDGILRFTIRGPQRTLFTARVSLGEYSLSGFRVPEGNILICEESGTLKITGENSPGGVTAEIVLKLKKELSRKAVPLDSRPADVQTLRF